jgi:hypothetical protein
LLVTIIEFLDVFSAWTGIEVNFWPFQDGVNANFGISCLLTSFPVSMLFYIKPTKFNKGKGPAYY